MSNQQHTPEPWRLGRFSGQASYEKVRETCGAMDVVADTDTGPYVLAGCNINFPDDAKANARRIVACVNACAGFTDKELDEVLSKGGFVEMARCLGRTGMRSDKLQSEPKLYGGKVKWIGGSYSCDEIDAIIDAAIANANEN